MLAACFFCSFVLFFSLFVCLQVLLVVLRLDSPQGPKKLLKILSCTKSQQIFFCRVQFRVVGAWKLSPAVISEGQVKKSVTMDKHFLHSAKWQKLKSKMMDKISLFMGCPLGLSQLTDSLKAAVGSV